MKRATRIVSLVLLACLVFPLCRTDKAYAAEMGDYQDVPLFLGARGVPPLVMLVMGRDHKLYYEAYNDASDLNNDGILDVGFKPAIEYYGYFDCDKCYTYSDANQRFEPHSEAVERTCTGISGAWSGNFLNYLTMSRMDALRKVLYGGSRSTDSDATGDSSVVLERVFIPQDAHSWGKEYNGTALSGYDIADYAPFDQPEEGTRHLFASTTLSTGGNPLLRVMPNNSHRIWEWVAKERPVCDGSLASGGGTYDSHPANHGDYEDFVARFGTASHLQGAAAPGNGRIDGSGNPYGPDDYYLTIFSGFLNVTTAGTYEFAVDGDDALEVIIDGTVVASWYNGHGSCGCQTHSGSIYLTAGAHVLEFRHQERTGGDNYYLWWKGPDSTNAWVKVPAAKYSSLIQSVYDVNTPVSTITDYVVRVVVCDPDMPEENCKEYPSDTLKPVGLLQKYGEKNKMFFGLITGSYTKNTSGGVLRKNISPLTGTYDSDTGEIDTATSEIDLDTGQFTNINGIIKTIDRFETVCFNYGNYSYDCNCGWIANRPINEGECRMWGNPIGEMMYEAVRYFAGKATPTSAYTYSGTTDDTTLGLALPTWEDPYDRYESCSKPIMLVISDINPSFDTDQLPGIDGDFGSFTGDVSGLDVSALTDTIGSGEGVSGEYYIGVVDSTDDCACTPKEISGLGSIRGLCPEEPTKKGGYYSAGVAYFGQKTDVHTTASGDQKIDTYAVALASPLPRITIPVGDGIITLVPFAKSVGGSYGPYTNFQPTNTIVDFFVETITDTYGKFRINYEDVEQGADHDMDAIVEYEYQVTGNSVLITLNSTYAAGSIIQHLGYIISGTNGADGTYLEVRDFDTSEANDVDYRLDTPPGVSPGGAWDDGTFLPLEATRTFSAGTTAGVTLLENPLWYAAKWGGFRDYNDSETPDETIEWDKDEDGVPDTYFYVQNPRYLEQQLGRAFSEIVQRVAAGSAVSVLATASEGEGSLYQAYFKPTVTEGTREVSWVGYLQGLWVDSNGQLREDTVSDLALVLEDDNIIEYVFDDSSGNIKIYKFSDADGDGKADSTSPAEIIPIENLKPMWEAGKLLALGTADNRTISTFVDSDNDGVVDAGEELAFTVANKSTLRPYLGAADDDVAEDIITYIRGDHVDGMRDRTLTVPHEGGETTAVWKLGDIVSSTPAVVGKPTSNYHLIYSDGSYAEYFRKHKDRDTVIYAGGNDGMIHAFWGGKYAEGDDDTSDDKDKRGYFSNVSSLANYIGDELWAYVPYNLLPHLRWLCDPLYPHVYYVDLKPRVVDARIFTADENHPNGWGTMLVVGMRLGGGEIEETEDFGGGSETRTFTSAYAAFDVTVPQSPVLMWEFTHSTLGYTTSFPTSIKVGNSWFCLFGSGPNDNDGISTRESYLYVLNLATGALEKMFELDDDAFCADPVAVDLGLDYSVDLVYIGETYSSAGVDSGKMLRLATNGSENPDDWTMLTLFETDSGQHITASPTVSFDYEGNFLVYFGTGKYISEADKSSTGQQTFYAIKDPFFDPDRDTSTPVAKNDLFNSTNVVINVLKNEQDAADQVTGAGDDINSWKDLLGEVRKRDENTGKYIYDGWYLSLEADGTDPSERVITKPAVLGGLVIFTTFAPNVDICSYGGSARVYVVNFETGTANRTSTIGTDETGEILKKTDEVFGMPSAPAVHTSGDTATVFTQLSTGEIERVGDIPIVPSGNVVWKEKR